MQLSFEDARNYHQALQRAKQAGMNWVIFNPEGTSAISANISAVGSLQAAQEACAPTLADYTGENDTTQYPYMPIDNMLQELGNQLSITPLHQSLVDPLLVESWLRQNNVAEINKNQIDNIAKGYFEAVQLKETIIPAQQVERFHIIEHEFPRGMIYEIGHTVREAYASDNAKSALRKFQQMGKSLKDNTNDNRVNLILVASFKGQALALNIEGYPDKNSGIALQDNFSTRLEDGSYQRVTRDVHALSAPYDLFYSPLAKFDRATNSLSFFNAAMQRIEPFSAKPADNYQDFRFSSTLNPTPPSLLRNANHQQLIESLQKYGFNTASIPGLKELLERELSHFNCLYTPKGGLIEGAALQFGVNTDRGNTALLNFTVWDSRKESLLPEFTVDLSKHPPFTLREAKNMVEGRSVLKQHVSNEGQIDHRWFRLNLKALDLEGKHPLHSYPGDVYALEKILVNKPIAEISIDSTRQQLIKDLERGDRVGINYQFPGDHFQQRGYLEALPRFNSLNYFDEKGRKVDMADIINSLQNKTILTNALDNHLHHKVQENIHVSKGRGHSF